MQLKHLCGSPLFKRDLLTKTKLVMKLTTILILSISLHVSGKSYAQNKITYSGKDVPLSKIISIIEKQTNYVFFYDRELIKEIKISVSVKDASVEELLDQCLKDIPLIYKIVDKTIIIKGKVDNINKVRNENSVPVFIDVKGKVLNEKGEPLIGASIQIKGERKGTETDKDGNYEIRKVPENSIVIVSFMGYSNKEVMISGGSFYIVTLQISTNPLDAIQIIAYGTTTERLNTGNVFTVKREDIEKQPVANPLLALEGRVPGLQITQGSGINGTGVTVRVQGLNSIQGGNDPLIVIDGVPYSAQMLATTSGGPYQILGKSGGSHSVATGNGNPLSYINPNDIENISVLKDADATSIYGSRAANGAILITTKKGKSGKDNIELDFQEGWGKTSPKLKMLNTKEYLEMRHEALNNDGLNPDPTYDYDLTLWDTTRYTDWKKQLTGGASQYTNINGSISGGTSRAQYLVGATFHRETTVFQSDFSDQKASVHFNLNTVSPNQRFHFQISGSYMHDLNQLPQLDISAYTYTLAPDAPPLKSSDGSLNWAPDPNGHSSWSNPLASLNNNYRNSTDNLVSSASLRYLLFPGLMISSDFGYNSLESKEYYPFSLQSIAPDYRSLYLRTADYTNSSIKSVIVEPQINYKRQLGIGRVNLLVGATIQQNNSDGNHLEGIGYPTDGSLMNISSAANISVVSSLNSVYKYAAIFGRLEYSLKNEYIFSISSRRDGSSRFGPANQFQNFSSIAGAWIFSEEAFFKKKTPILTFGKLKASYGTTGSDQIGDYSYLNLYTTVSGISVPYQGITSLGVLGLSNPYLQWEETRKASFGLDLGFFHDRVMLSSVYARNQSSNELLSYALPIIVGAQSVVRNFPATVQNESWEFSLNTNNIKSDKFLWNTSITLTVPKNKLVSFPNLSKSSYASTLLIGQPISVIKAFHFLGANDSTGIYQFQSKGGPTNDPVVGTDDNAIINTMPKIYGGIQNSFRYKRIQFDLYFQFVKQQSPSFFNFGNPNNPPGIANNNQPNTILNRWRKIGDNKDIQRYNSDGSIYTQWLDAEFSSDASYSDASYIRLKNLSFSYSLPEALIQKTGLKSFKINVLVQNFLTFTKYKGIDPETQAANLPPLKIIVFGLHIGF